MVGMKCVLTEGYSLCILTVLRGVLTRVVCKVCCILTVLWCARCAVSWQRCGVTNAQYPNITVLWQVYCILIRCGVTSKLYPDTLRLWCDKCAVYTNSAICVGYVTASQQVTAALCCCHAITRVTLQLISANCHYINSDYWHTAWSLTGKARNLFSGAEL